MSTPVPEQLPQGFQPPTPVPKPPPLLAPTPYFKKWGSTHERFLPDGKSGLTPLKSAVYPLGKEDWAFRRRIRDYQLHHLDPFTSRDLLLSDALDDPTVAPSDLQGIHQIFALENWTSELPNHLAPYPLGHGRTGEFWTADNPDVWRILQPVLALTTKFIENCHIWPWWDAVLLGERVGIPSKPGRKKFYARPAIESTSLQSRIFIRAFISGLVHNPRPVKFAIAHGSCGPHHGLGVEDIWKAIYLPMYLRKWGEVRVMLSYDRLDVLLFGDITEAERLMAQFDLAVNLFHELAHAVGSEIAPLDRYEAYYENESVPELGHSMINAIFGGRSFAFGQECREVYFDLRKQPPLGIVFQEGFPTRLDTDDPDLVLDEDLLKGYGSFTEWAVTARYISDIQKEAFWTDRVATYGLDALRPHPPGIGIELTIGPDQEPTTKFKTFDPHLDPRLSAEIVQLVEQRNSTLLKAIEDAAEEDEVFEVADYEMIYGNSSELDFNTVSDVDEAFDPDMECTPRIAEIRNLLDYYRIDLAFYTMIEWTPANLVFNYIHRLIPGVISPEDFRQFLIFCQCCHQLFEYRRRGEGEVRTIRPGWTPLPPKPPVQRPAGHGEVKAQINEFKNQIFEGNRELCDFDINLFFERLQPLSALAGLAPITREAFDRSLKYMDYQGVSVVYGPRGIIRRVMRVLEAEEEGEEMEE